MSTELQKNLAQEIVKNVTRKKPKNKKELLVSSGYAEKSALSVPGKIIEQKGVQDELERLGFSEDKAKRVVAEIMNNIELDPNARLKAADMTLKVYGSYAPEKTQSLNVNVNTVDPKVLELAQEYEQKLKEGFDK